jgi:GNAT superfamily N-acetyltransferase
MQSPPPDLDFVLLWDRQQALPLGQTLREDDLLLLLTPVVIPVDNPNESRDPFEALGRALASFHPAVRHVPYTKENGITAYHKDFIQRCRVIVFVMSGPPGDNEPSQADMALIALNTSQDSVFLVIACFDSQEYDLPMWNLPTVFQTQGYETMSLQAAARFAFATPGATPYPAFEDASEIAPRQWQVGACRFDDDIATIHNLWHDCLPGKFQISRHILSSLLDRASCLCLVVRQPITGEVLGFCAIYTADQDLSDSPRIGSLAALMVRKKYRGRGIGRSLHDAGVRALGQSSGVEHIRLGSTFPRLLHGVPDDSRFGGWFARRGWHGEAAPLGQNPDASDWLLELGDVAERGLSMAGLSFQRYTPSDREQVLRLVASVSTRKGHQGWLTQYTRVANSNFKGDIIVGFEGATIVSTAILYMPSLDHPFVQDMPWAQSIGSDVGGLSCICILGTLLDRWAVMQKLTHTDQEPGMVNNRDSIMVRLLDYSVKTLAGGGYRYMFLDAVRGGDHGFPGLGE